MLLSKAPETLQKMRIEHTGVFGETLQATVETLLSSPELLQNLPYTDAIIRESLRMFPVGFGVRAGTPGQTLSHNGRDLPVDNGLALCLSSHGLHYNPKYFSEPTAFRPERWLADAEPEIPRAYFRTFGRGPRACAGQNLATNELKIILLLIARDYSFEVEILQPNAKPRGLHTDLDTVFGDWVFQELGLEAKPRRNMKFRVSRTQA